MQITAQMVGELREQTGAGMMECKKALTEAEGDMERARDLLRSRGQAAATKRAGRAAADGAVAVAKADDAWSLIELNSETDFVARNEEFKALATQIAHAAARHPKGDVDGVLQEKLESGQTVRAALDEALARMRENLVLRRSVRYATGPDTVLAEYVHTVDNKTGVLVELKGDPNNEAHRALGRSIAMHIAFAKPKYLGRDEVPADAIEHEKQVLTELTRNEGKPEAAIPKIVEGRLGKFFEGLCLVDQPYVREQSKKVGQLAKEAGAEIRRFTLYVVGQE